MSIRHCRRPFPISKKTSEVEDIGLFLEAIVKSTDCSLVAEWEALQTERVAEQPAAPDSVVTVADQLDITQSGKAFVILVKNAVFGLLRALARGDWATAQAGTEWFDGTRAAGRHASVFR